MVKVLRAVRINQKDIQRLKKLAKTDGESISFLIQQAIKEFLARRTTK
jgi:predicted transcriptional regulator